MTRLQPLEVPGRVQALVFMVCAATDELSPTILFFSTGRLEDLGG
jgi:hypothetical protein